MRTGDIANNIELFLREAFGIAADDPGFNHSVDLFEAGYVDSVGLVETLAYLTATFGVSVPDQVLLSDSFATIDGMAQAVAGILAEVESGLGVAAA